MKAEQIKKTEDLISKLEDEVAVGKDINTSADFFAKSITMGLVIEVKEYLHMSKKRQADVARVCGYSRAYISKFLKYKQDNMELRSLCKIALACGLKPELSFKPYTPEKAEEEPK